MAAKAQIIEMLAQGLPPTVIAAAIGVSESYVSQLAGNEDVATQVQEVQAHQQEVDRAYDSKMDRIEDGFLDRIDEKSKFANLQQSLQAFRVLNSARRRKESRGIGAGTAGPGIVVNITLPTAVIPHFVMNSSAEIVEVQGKTMIAATTKDIDSVLQKKLPSPSQEVRAVEALQKISNRPFRSAIKHASGEELQDLL